MSENPKHYAGSKKLPFAETPSHFLFEMNLAMYVGACKYSSFNYRQDAIRASDYISAIKRHLAEFEELGEDVDLESGLSPLAHIAAGCAILRDAQTNGMLIDDRPPPIPRSRWEWLQRAYSAIKAKFPNPPKRVKEWGVKVGEKVEAPKPGAGATIPWGDIVEPSEKDRQKDVEALLERYKAIAKEQEEAERKKNELEEIRRAKGWAAAKKADERTLITVLNPAVSAFQHKSITKCLCPICIDHRTRYRLT